MVFYVSGTFTCLWYVAWLLLVYDSPTIHPRISENEKQYILKSLGESYAKEKVQTQTFDKNKTFDTLTNKAITFR